MPEGPNGGVKMDLDGTHLRVDARPARLVSMLRSSDGGAVLTAQPVSGRPRTEAVPGGARQATFRVRDGITVEATAAADFVAIAEDSGRCVVISYGGEVTVVPGGEERFALAAHEALVLPAGPGDPEVVPADDLSATERPELSALLDAAADALLGPMPTPPHEVETGAPALADPPSTKVAPPAKAAAAPAKAASKSAGGGRRKKGKKGRPQPSKSGAKKAGIAAGAAKAPAKATGGGTRPPAKQPPGGGGGRGGGGDDAGGRDGGRPPEPAEEPSRDNRFLVGAVVAAIVVAIVLVFLLTADGDDDTDEVATDSTTTTADADADETTTSDAPTTTTTGATNTTTTARPATTTTSAAAPNYSIEPKSCIQNGNSVTYTATVKNDASVPFDFTVDVSFKSADGDEVATATTTVTKLAAGASKKFSATGTSSRNLAGTGASCDVTRVDPVPSR